MLNLKNLRLMSFVLFAAFLVNSAKAFADFGRRALPRTACAVKIENMSSTAKTDYGQIPFEFVRVTIESLGQNKVGRIVDVPDSGIMSLDGRELNPITVNAGGTQMDVQITVGQGHNRNIVTYGSAGGDASNECE